MLFVIPKENIEQHKRLAAVPITVLETEINDAYRILFSENICIKLMKLNPVGNKYTHQQ
jgi:hypothetical protein